MSVDNSCTNMWTHSRMQNTHMQSQHNTICICWVFISDHSLSEWDNIISRCPGRRLCVWRCVRKGAGPTLSTAIWLPIPTPPIPHLQGHAAVQRGSQGLSVGAELCLGVGWHVSVPAFPEPPSPKPPATTPAAPPPPPPAPLTCPNAQW